jgi:WD40 repeat protein
MAGPLPLGQMTGPSASVILPAAVQTPKGHSDLGTAVDFSPDGLLVASGSDDKTVWL